jgi:hypothetical protein
MPAMSLQLTVQVFGQVIKPCQSPGSSCPDLQDAAFLNRFFVPKMSGCPGHAVAGKAGAVAANARKNWLFLQTLPTIGR